MAAKWVWAWFLIATLWSPAPSLAVPATMQDTGRHLYDRVMEEFKHGDYEAALAGFRLFLQLHHKSALAANAQFWIGECQYRLGRYDEALDSFYKASAYGPSSAKVAAAEFKIGQTYSKLGDHEKARLMLEQVVVHYPNSAEAELARKAMGSINPKVGSISQP
jgi:tol-pal system protein YbgF